MTRNTRASDERIRRRENVARLRLRGLSQREIVGALAKLTDTDGRPAPITCDLAQVNRDLKTLRAEWRTRAAEAIDERKAHQLAEIDEAKRRAWSDGDLANLLRALKLESDIFGTAAPAKVEVYDWRSDAAAAGLDPDKLATELFSKVTHDAGNADA